MDLKIKEVTQKRGFQDFVDVQFKVNEGNKNWVPPLKMEEVKSLMPKFNPAFRFCRAKFWVVYNGKYPVGRIGAIINQKYNSRNNTTVGRFTRVEFIDHYGISELLFTTAADWLKRNGMSAIHGPLGFTNLDHQGMLIEGFEHAASSASVYHPAYYKVHMERSGFRKEIDWIEFKLFLSGIPEKVKRVAEIVTERNGLTVKKISRSKDLIPYGVPIFNVFNEAFKDLFSVVPFDDEMVNYYTERYLSFLNPEFIILVLDKKNELIAFTLGVPSLANGLRKAKGRLLPFGWYHIKKALKKSDCVDLMLTGVLPKYQGRGVAAVLIRELQTVMEKYGISELETTGIFENNVKAIQHWKNYKNIQHKRKRCWTKTIE